VLVLVGAYMRANIEESQAFSELAARSQVVQAPLWAVLRKYKKETLITLLVCLAETAFFYLTTIFAIGYGVKTLGIRQSVLTTAFLMANCVAAATVPLLGALSDRVGRRPLLAAGLLAACAYIYPFFRILGGGDPLWVTTAVIASAGLIHPIMFAAEASFVPELFETPVRVTGASLGKQLGTVLGGGLAPLIATSLIGWTRGATTLVVWYFLAMGIAALLAVLMARETSKTSLDSLS